MATKTYKRPVIFKQTITAAEATATSGVVQLITDSTALPSDDFIFVAQTLRAGVDTTGIKYSYTSGTGYFCYSGTLVTDDVVSIIGTFQQ